MKIFIFLLVILLVNCRPDIVGVEDAELWSICDTINIKYNPRDSLTTCTLRCVDEYGDESIIYINCGE